MDLRGHKLITNEGVGAAGRKELDDARLDWIVNANCHEDLKLSFENQDHFNNCAFADGSRKIREAHAAIAAMPDRLSRPALEALGGLLHTVQDFYSHSNWIELHENDSPVPLWDLDVGSLPPGIVSGRSGVGAEVCPRKACMWHSELNKDHPNSPRGKARIEAGPNQDKTYWDLARRAAVEATTHEVCRAFEGVTTFQVVVQTGDLKRAGTDARVFVVLRGPQGEATSKIFLKSPDRNDFERGSRDEFQIGVRGAPQDLAEIAIGYDPLDHAGVYPGWYLEWVQVRDTGSGRSWVFPCCRWLAVDAQDKKTVVELAGHPG